MDEIIAHHTPMSQKIAYPDTPKSEFQKFAENGLSPLPIIGSPLLNNRNKGSVAIPTSNDWAQYSSFHPTGSNIKIIKY